MDKNDKSIQKPEIENTKREIIELRIKNNFYNQSSVIDKVIDEILFEQISIKEKRNNTFLPDSQ
jgi:hypothetical protein